MHFKEKLLFDWLTEILHPLHQNYDGLDRLNSNLIEHLRYVNAADLLRPSSIIYHEFKDKENDVASLDLCLSSNSFHINRVLKRDIRFVSFLQKVNKIIKRVFPSKECLNIEFLAGDSHNGGQRPTKLVFEEEEYVLKFADPQAYQILLSVTEFIAEKAEIFIKMPSIFAFDCDEGWYVIPFIRDEIMPERDEENVQQFMYKLGALTALAFSLSMVDAHIENVIIWENHPIIIDPECILYLMSDMPQDDKLLSTGLLSHNVHLSALRGGGVPMRTMGQTLDTEGILRYSQPLEGFRNRLNIKGIGTVDPADYKKSVINGFTSLYWFIEANSEELVRIVRDKVTDNFRVRFLVRKTKHYLSVMEMINLPQLDYKSSIAAILARFSDSGSFHGVSPELLAAEWADMLGGDVPYFWVKADDTAIYHHSGVIQHNTLEYRIIDKIDTLFSSMNQIDFELQREILNQFLDVKIHEAVTEFDTFNPKTNSFFAFDGVEDESRKSL
jgi:lantibiotic modifying enzyme